jgi:hypothetical protein
METSTVGSEKPLPSLFDRFPMPTTQPNTSVVLRKAAYWSSWLAVPALYAAGRALGFKKTGAAASGLAMLGLGLVRWQFARWFAETPAYDLIRHEGSSARGSTRIELRQYPFRIEARVVVDTNDLDAALDQGQSLLECYLYGANDRREQLGCSTPMLATMHDGMYTIAMVMPPGRSISSLPHPDDSRVMLREVSEKNIAVWPFHGGFSKDNFGHKQRRFLRSLVDAGLVAKGSTSLAVYDGVTTLGRFKKNELWIEVI